jgi:hypothetical protein
MQFINLEYPASCAEVLEILSDNERVNKNVTFDERRGKPLMRIKDKGNGKIKITCEMLERATKDNGFFVGTYFSGKLTEKKGVTRLKGIILTAPIYHLMLFAMIAVFIFQCIRMNGFSVIPVMLVIFDIFMFKDEFRKQGYIRRYLYRAVRRITSDIEKNN